MTNTLSEQHIIIVGASRGLGRGMALALAREGAHVLGIGRDREALDSLVAEGEGRIEVARGDATDPTFIGESLASRSPSAIVMVAGATPLMRPLGQYTWEALSQPWEVDVKAAFHWLQAVLHQPLNPGGRFVQISSGAALHGSPLSGGYAGAKQTQRFLVRYAAKEAAGRELGMHFQTLLPQLNPNTALGRAGIAAYAEISGEDPEAFVSKRFGPRPLSPEIAGAALVELLTRDELRETPEFLLTGGGLRALDPK